VLVKLAEQVQLRRLARGKEPLRLAHIERVIRFVAGPRPPAGRCGCFQVKARATGTDIWHEGALRLRRVYTRAPRGA
jgi:hypothetical protein